jgi:hypothetical protein
MESQQKGYSEIYDILVVGIGEIHHAFPGRLRFGPLYVVGYVTQVRGE